MTHDETREPAERLTALRHEDRVAPDDVIEQYAKSVFESIPVAEGEPLTDWNDPRAARFRRAVAAEANRKGRANRRAREAEAQVQALRQELESAYGLIEQTGANYRALEERYKALYVEHGMLLAQQDQDEGDGDSQSPAASLD
ncbi:hypothetical protein [Jiangella gansuensis]|uniref:hypothetical protein n=1 Tax=Jiangella gansuensis TaxID=281473 RepID=UPI0012FB7524|nr:hypothetical protein [Jiangella gansuensis]